MRRRKLTPRRVKSAFSTETEARDDCEEPVTEPVHGDDCEATADDGEDEVDAENEGDNAIDEGDNAIDEGDYAIDEGDYAIVEYGADREVENAGIAAEESDGDSVDDFWKEEKIPDHLSSDDEEGDERREALEEAAHAEEHLALGKTFDSASEFKLSLLRYSLKSRYDIKMYLSTQYKLGARCTDTKSSCPWRVYCSYEKRKHKLQIKVYVNEHICIRSGYSKMLKVSTIANLFEERLRLNPKLTKEEMAEDIKRVYNLIVTANQCGKAKTKVFAARKASHEAHFSRIWDYQAEVLSSNPGTTMEIQTIPGPFPGSKQRFDRLYVCFEAQRTAWLATCRPIIGLDGAFLKWDIKGHLLAAIGRDGDNRIVPIAWAVVEVENDSNWAWFVNHIKGDLGLGDGRNITIISDKHKGLVKAMITELPLAEHRMCARHILGNWKRDSHDLELERLFWKIARSYTKGDYAENLESLKKYNLGAYESLLRTNPVSWSRAYFKVGSCCNDNLNNLTESFNRTIREARRKPLLELLESIRRQCMVRTAKRSIIASRLRTRFTKSAHAEIERSKTDAKDCIRHMATCDTHEIECHGVGYRVEMDLKTCGCGKWQMNGIPCNHATCVIIAKKLRVEDYVSEYYTTQKWQQTYERSIRPVQGMKLWPRLNRLPVLPPQSRVGNPGRPSNYARRKSANEAAGSSSKATKLSRDKRIMTCSNCREEGHNKLSCANPRVESEPKRPRGRPKMYQEQQSQGVSQGLSQGVSQGLSQGGSQGDSQRGSQGDSQGGSQGGSQRGGSQRRGSQSGGSQRGGAQRGGSQRGGAQRQGSQRGGTQRQSQRGAQV